MIFKIPPQFLSNKQKKKKKKPQPMEYSQQEPNPRKFPQRLNETMRIHNHENLEEANHQKSKPRKPKQSFPGWWKQFLPDDTISTTTYRTNWRHVLSRNFEEVPVHIVLNIPSTMSRHSSDISITRRSRTRARLHRTNRFTPKTRNAKTRTTQ